eukprot:COSAG05_NODE_101_length_19100_cov_24.260144_18_plen_43_part_00
MGMRNFRVDGSIVYKDTHILILILIQSMSLRSIPTAATEPRL